MNAPRTLFGLVVLACLTGTVSGQGLKWGTVKGRVVFDGDVPKPKVIAAARGVAACVACDAVGPFDEEWVVDPKTKGVRWVMVWLVPQKESGKIPVHPKLAKPAAEVVLDQPCCAFVPHVLGMRTGQVLVAKNSATFAHNINVLGGDDNPSKNVLIPPGKEVKIEGWKASPSPVPVQCNIHSWMNAQIRVFDHPYFAVTNEKGEFEIKDAPAGNYRIAVSNNLWIVRDGEKPGRRGVPLEIKPDAVTDLGDIKAKP